LFHLVTGTLPYEGATPASVYVKHVTAPVPSAVRARAEVPADLDAVIRRMMAKAPADRFASADEVALALERFCRETPPPAPPPPGAPARPATPAARRAGRGGRGRRPRPRAARRPGPRPRAPAAPPPRPRPPRRPPRPAPPPGAAQRGASGDRRGQHRRIR